MHSKRDNIEIMITVKQIKLLKNILNQFLINIKLNWRGSDFIFDYVHLLYYKCHKTIFKRGRSYIDSPEWMKKKKSTINPINKKYNKCFQYAITVMLNHEKIETKNLQRGAKIKSFINKCKWKKKMKNLRNII